MSISTAIQNEFQVRGEIIRGRQSCRAFDSRPVPRDVIEQILLLAQNTPSWCNTQPWHVLIVSGEACARLADRLYQRAALNLQNDDFEIAPAPRYEGISLERRRAAGWALYDAVGCARGDREASREQALKNFRFFGAPHIAIISSTESIGPYGLVDCGGYINNFMLAAASLGVATIAQASVVRFPDVIREELTIAPNTTLVCGISFGFADENDPANKFRTARATLTDVVSFQE